MRHDNSKSGEKREGGAKLLGLCKPIPSCQIPETDWHREEVCLVLPRAGQPSLEHSAWLGDVLEEGGFRVSLLMKISLQKRHPGQQGARNG